MDDSKSDSSVKLGGKSKATFCLPFHVALRSSSVHSPDSSRGPGPENENSGDLIGLLGADAYLYPSVLDAPGEKIDSQYKADPESLARYAFLYDPE